MAAAPIFPTTLVAGVTPCGRSWLVASAKLQGPMIAPKSPQLLAPFSEVLDQRPSYSIIAYRLPWATSTSAPLVGGPAIAKPGPCSGQSEVRRFRARPSGPRRTSSSSSTSISTPSARPLLPRFREVAAEMAPFRQRSVYEVHSELSFYELNGGIPMGHPKHTESGREERRDSSRPSSPGSKGSSRPSSRARAHLISSTWLPSVWTADGSSLVPRCGFPRMPSGTNRDCAWRSCADMLPRASGGAQECGVNGRSRPDPANTATAHPAARNTP